MPKYLTGTTPVACTPQAFSTARFLQLDPRPTPRCQKSVCTKRKRPSGNKAPELPCLGTSKEANETGQVMDCQNMSHSMDTNTIYMAIYGCYPGGGCALTITGRPSSDSRIAWAKVASQISTCAFEAGRRISGLESRQVGQKGVRRRGKTTSIPRHVFLHLSLSGAREKESEEGEPKKTSQILNHS